MSPPSPGEAEILTDVEIGTLLGHPSFVRIGRYRFQLGRIFRTTDADRGLPKNGLGRRLSLSRAAVLPAVAGAFATSRGM